MTAPRVTGQAELQCSWHKANQEITVAAAFDPYLSGGEAERFHRDVLEQATVERFATAYGAEAERSDVLVAGVPARHVRWRAGGKSADVYLLVRGGYTYLIGVHGVEASGDVDDLVAGFSLIE